MMRRKRKEKNTPMNISFCPEEIVKVMSDVTVEFFLEDDEMYKLLDLIDRYRNDAPKILVKIDSPTRTLTLTNLQLQYCGIDQFTGKRDDGN